MNFSTDTILYSYKHCLNIAKNHYENFPVASFLLPKKIRYAVAAVYAFARQADDFSDEGDLSNQERLLQLKHCEDKLKQIKNHTFSDNNDFIYIALQDSINKFNLPMELFFDLIAAFKQDVVKASYNNFNEVLEYCKQSANPVGRLLLHLTGNDSTLNLQLSDKICTSLQLINFLQDIYSDAIDRERCYMPINEMQQYNMSIDSIKAKQESPNFSQFIRLQIDKANVLMTEGKELGKNLKGIFGLEIRLIVSGGERIIQELYNRDSIYDRPTIKAISWLTIFFKAIFK